MKFLYVLLLLLIFISVVQSAVVVDTLKHGSHDGFYRTGGAQFSTVSSINSFGLSSSRQCNGEVIFDSTKIPYSATIDSAFISFRASATQATSVSVRWYCEDTASSTALTADSTTFKTRLKTTASVLWSTPSVTSNTRFSTGNLKDPLQEKVNRVDHTKNSNIGFIWNFNSGTVVVNGTSFDNGILEDPIPILTVYFSKAILNPPTSNIDSFKNDFSGEKDSVREISTA